MAEHKNGKKTNEDLSLFLLWDYVLNHHHTIDTTVASIVAVFFNSCSYYNSYTWTKALHWQLNKVILYGMYNCNFEAIN